MRTLSQLIVIKSLSDYHQLKQNFHGEGRKFLNIFNVFFLRAFTLSKKVLFYNEMKICWSVVEKETKNFTFKKIKWGLVDINLYESFDVNLSHASVVSCFKILTTALGRFQGRCWKGTFNEINFHDTKKWMSSDYGMIIANFIYIKKII